MTPERKRYLNGKIKNANFKLPPGITSRKQILSDGNLSYCFRHNELGELGRLVVKPIAERHTLLNCEVAGNPADPMTAKRQAILEPITKEVSKIMENIYGPPPDVPIPPQTPLQEPKTLVQSKLLQCIHCDAFVAMLIFAHDAYTPDRIEDYARMMYPEYSKKNLPTWVIGAPHGDDFEAPSYILKVWPSRETVRLLRPSDVNPELETIQEMHCGNNVR